MGISIADTISFIPFDFGSKNNSSIRLLSDMQSKKKEMNNFLFCIKTIYAKIKIKVAIPI